MDKIEISSREFLANPRACLDYIDQGTQIVVKRRAKVSFTITPAPVDAVDEDDYRKLSPALKACIEQGLKDIREGKGMLYTTMEDFIQQMES